MTELDIARYICSDPIDPGDLGIFPRMLSQGVDYVLIQAGGSRWVAFLTAKPPIGYPGRRLGRADAARAMLTYLQRGDPAQVRTSPGWAILKHRPAPAGDGRPRLAGEWRPDIIS